MEWLEYIYYKVSSFVDGVLSVFSYIRSILESLWYGLSSMCTAVLQLVQQVFTSGIFDNISYGFNLISSYIGGPATTFIATVLIVVILRYGVAFLFKIFRLNLDNK